MTSDTKVLCVCFLYTGSAGCEFCIKPAGWSSKRFIWWQRVLCHMFARKRANDWIQFKYDKSVFTLDTQYTDHSAIISQQRTHTHQTQCQLNMPQMSAELGIYSTSNNVCVSISEERQGINTRRTQTRDRTQAKRWKVRHIQIWYSM